MSIISFLAGLWAGIKRIFKKMPAQLKAAVAIGVLVTQNIKTVLGSRAIDVLTAIIPGQTDDRIKDLLRAAIPKILDGLLMIQATYGITDPQAIVDKALEILEKMDPEFSAAHYHNIAVLIAQVAADGKLTWSDGVAILEYYYKNEYKPLLAA